MLDRNFLRAMVKVMALGLKDGRTANDWMVNDRTKKWKGAIARHLEKYEKTGRPHHMAKVAVNAMFVWFHNESTPHL